MPRPFYALHRAELGSQLEEGDRRFGELVEPRGVSVDGRRTLVAAGQAQSLVYRLRSGWCARRRYLKGGRSQVSAILLPGDLVAVRAMFLERQPDDITTITACEFDQVDQAVLREAAATDPALMLRLWWQSLEDERRLQNWLVAIGRGRAEEKLALLMLDIHGRLALTGLVAADAAQIPWPLTQHELGEILGLTAVHINRTLRLLRSEELATVKSHVAHLDLAGLYSLAQPLMDIFERQRPEYGAPASA